MGSSEIMKAGSESGTALRCGSYLGLPAVSYFIYFASRIPRLQIHYEKKIEATRARKADISVMGDAAKTLTCLADCKRSLR